MATETQEKKRIIIAGGGVSAMSCIERLVDHIQTFRDVGVGDLAPLLEVEIVAAGSEIGSGLVWSRKNVGQNHLANVYEYLKQPEIKSVPNATAHDIELLAEGHTPRALAGDNYERRYQEAISELKRMGVTVKETMNTTVDKIADYNGQYLVEMSDKKSFVEKTADYVVLATGHWQGGSSTNDAPGVFSAWPASRLEKEISPNQPIAVMGASLSAVDAMMTLAHSAGTFTREGGNVAFVPKKGSEDFKLVAYSPHGMLPPMLGAIDRGSKLEFDFMPAFNGKFIELDRIYDIIRHDFIKRHKSQYRNDPDYRAIIAILGDDKLSIEEAVGKIYEAYKKQGPLQWLKGHIGRGNNSLWNNAPIFWQTYLRKAAIDMEAAYKYFNAEDTERFMTHVRPIYTKLAYPMVKRNAEDMLALMKAGRLEVRAMGDHHVFSTTPGKQGAHIRYWDEAGAEHNADYNIAVKATGDDLYQLPASSPLMKQLFNPKNPMVSEVLVPFADQKKGEAAYNEEQRADPSYRRIIRKKTEKGGGVTYCRSSGGLNVGARFEAMKPGTEETHAGFFVMGPILKADQPLYEATNIIQDAANQIIGTISSELIHMQHAKGGRLGVKSGSVRKASLLVQDGISDDDLTRTVAKLLNVNPNDILFTRGKNSLSLQELLRGMRRPDGPGRGD